MSLKSWVLDRVQRINALHGRADLPPRESMLTPDVGPQTQAPESRLSESEHLGPYAALIAAVRDELEHFVVSHVRLHLAIADHDRFVLTSIGVDCPGGGEARALLQQFMREFKPEQVKRYLAREVIAGLPNASAIDLSQFAGLIDTQARDDDEDDEYADLIDVLRGAAATPAARPYQVSIAGRWTELETPVRPAAPAAGAPRSNGSALTTPLAGQRCEFDVEDADGRRRVVLQSVVAGRRYIVGKGEASDLRVNGTYTSRRHAELWQEQGTWWIADAGSTNGLRVEWPTGSVERCGGPESGSNGNTAIKLLDGARIVLSAQAQGPAADYPWLALRVASTAAPRVTPIAGVAPAPKTALTPILLSRPVEGLLTLTARLASGERVLELRAGMLPVTIGRSRTQQLVIDRVHEAVSGHHLDIVELDETGVQVLVHGDNGVVVDGMPHPVGARFRWKPGQAMVLGAGLHDHPACTLVLTKR